MSDLEAMAAALEATGDYRVLRRLPERHFIADANGEAQRLGIVCDVETTGLDLVKDEIIELAMVPFLYTPGGRVLEISEAVFQRFRQPTIPISPEITALTGIDDAMVAGHAIDPAEVAQFAAPALLIIAHHAEFDRPVVQRFCPAFADKHWACSMSEINWAGEGIEGKKLSYLVSSYGFFYERHRAVADCRAVVELLARPLPRSGVSGLSALLEAARKPTWRIWAKGSPFEAKDTLKDRGYRWSPGGNGQPKSWFIDVKGEDARDDEISFLQRKIGLLDAAKDIERLTARERFT